MLRDAGIQSLLCEGGGALGARLLADGLVDRLYWWQAPVWLGEAPFRRFPGFRRTRTRRAALDAGGAEGSGLSDTLLVLDRRLCLPES